ncbi:adhesion G-protein coupled receptor G2-like [Sinocyclocheilus rhinocerous]|uniref:adhesion G-protein coupled receptor G2-like n=1 Tax=Sinocyclocheilus rhinocerous TaxID=307959 RepID=UPI0007B9DC19|nr:PREDICTED: adhesion G-protein coupled receptor G2-like [Sinocyclocheilus rhinocerous]
MSDAKAVLHGCDDHWTFQEQGRMPVLFQTTVCVDVQVLSPGEWTAFSYVSAPAPRYELALQGDANNLYAWLLGVRHQFTVQLTIHRWYHICLRWDAPRKSFSLTIGGNSEVYQRTAIARAIPPTGRLLLGCQPNEASPVVKMATVELYLFRIWDDVGEHRACEDGTVIGWDSRLWAVTRAQARVQDYTLQCGLGHLRMKRSADETTTPYSGSSSEKGSSSTPVSTSLLCSLCKGLCPEHNNSPPGDGLVHCTSPMTYDDFCKTQGPVNVTCSYKENGFVPKDLVANQSCNVENQQHCECHVSTNNETYYAVRLNIRSPDVNFPYIQDMAVIDTLQGMHLECFGEGTSAQGQTFAVILNESCEVSPSESYPTQAVPPRTSSESKATTKNPNAVASNLLNQTQNVASLNSTQVNQLVSQLENLISTPNISLDLGRTVLSVINNFLNSSTDTLAASSNRLIKAVDNLGLKLVIRDQTENIAFDSLALTVTKVDGSNFGTTSISIADPLNPQVTKGLQRQVRAVESSSPLAKITLPASLTENLSPEEKKIASRVQFTFFQKSTFFQDKNLSQHMLNSHILGSSVANLSIKKLRENVEFTLRNKQPPGNYVASCVFWDFHQNGGLGGWNHNGCYVKNSSENETICSCNHLTSFAVLLDISQQILPDLQDKILTFITYIGCGVSAIFLSVTLLTYLAFDKIRRDIPSKILIHLCFSLLLLNLVFLLDSWLALYRDAEGLCIFTAFFLHYFLLVSFTWMGLEALHMYLAIVKVFNNFMSRYMLKFSLVGWGVPLVVVIIVIAVNKENYGLISYGRFSDGTKDFCWLNNSIAFYVAVVAYFCIIFVLNLAMFVVVMIHLRRIKRRNPHNNQYRSSLHDLRSVAGLTFLLGLTWGFAFFAWGPVHFAFTYMFTILNSLQGFLIFIFHCALKENVRKQWRMYLCCGSLRLAENSEWSRTATQSNHTKKTSIVTADSGIHSAPRSSVSSDDSVPSQGIGSPMDDSLIISGEMNDDVVLNEMNSQIRPRFRSE